MKKEYTVITHFFADDTSCGGDYVWIEIVEGDKQLARYGDSYHDSGEEKAEGYLDACKDIYGADNINVIYKSVADSEY